MRNRACEVGNLHLNRKMYCPSIYEIHAKICTL